MAASYKQAMDMMIKRMNVLIVGHGKMAEDKANALPANSNTGRSSGSTKCKRKKCMHCRKHVFHKSADCYELKTNTSTRWAG
jgi:hypothetical protein